MFYKMLTLLFVMVSLPLLTAADGNVYCEEDYFSAECQEGEVILITSARYGRMELNRCVKTNHNYLGCNTNCLTYVDTLCSGKKTCTFRIFEHKAELKKANSYDRPTKTCPDDFVQFLRVEYECIKVTNSLPSTCYTDGEVPVTAESGFIASSITQETSIGSIKCPYTFNVDSGMKLNLTLLNFNRHKQDDTGQFCVPIARIWAGTNREGQEITLCDDNGRGASVGIYTSPVKIEIMSDLKDGTNFLFGYKAVGCANVKPRPNTVIIREDNKLTVKCNTTNEIRYLVCKGDEWSGEIQNCPHERKSEGLWATGDDEFPIGILIVVAIGVALGVFLGGITLVAVSIHMKRKQEEKRRQLVYMSPPDFSPIHADELHETLQRNCAQCTIERASQPQQGTKMSTYMPAANMEGNIKDYPLFEKNAASMQEANKLRAHNLTNSTRTLPHRAHIIEVPPSNNNRLT